MASPVLIPGVVAGLCAAMIAFPQGAAADTTLTPLPDSPRGDVLVKSPSGDAKCVVKVDLHPHVMCSLNRSFPIPDGVDCSPLPVVDVVFSSDGELEYGCGGNGYGLNADPAWFQQLEFGTAYEASGWSITPTDDGITFINGATGRGMTFTPRAVNTF